MALANSDYDIDRFSLYKCRSPRNGTHLNQIFRKKTKIKKEKRDIIFFQQKKSIFYPQTNTQTE
ncbi:hypothetical protein DERP_008145 [Dermatophagoides pteronyssinus]|uniref:Uncharacterized protein n=1 Tax=Dermatophagoides pteronyssinus TaxID=6956 RepID=A0ABQ8JKB0_DERPT|nr:hypothetical protein DERP_008145 [Dermatophagoides pteronyssinus]